MGGEKPHVLPGLSHPQLRIFLLLTKWWAVFCVMPGCIPNSVVSLVQHWFAVALLAGWCLPSVSALLWPGRVAFLLLTKVCLRLGFPKLHMSAGTACLCCTEREMVHALPHNFVTVLLIGELLEWVIFVEYKGLRCWSYPGANPLAHRRWSRSECCLKRLSHGFTNVLWPEDVFLTSKGFSGWLGASQTESTIPLCSWCVLTMCDFFGMWCFLKEALTCVQVKLVLKLVNTNLSCGQFSS